MCLDEIIIDEPCYLQMIDKRPRQALFIFIFDPVNMQ